MKLVAIRTDTVDLGGAGQPPASPIEMCPTCRVVLMPVVDVFLVVCRQRTDRGLDECQYRRWRSRRCDPRYIPTKPDARL